MDSRGPDALPQPRSGHVSPRPRRPVALSALLAVEGAALAALAGLDGSPVWQVARILIIAAVTTGAVWLTRRAGRAGQGPAAVLLGIAGTATGAGVAGAHLAKAGLDAAALLAVIVLAAGLVLLGWGAAALIGAIPGWWRLLAIPVVLAMAQFVLMPLTFAFYATSVPPGPLGAGTPARYGLAYQDVAFRTADGVRLSGWYIPARGGVVPGPAARHPCRQDRRARRVHGR